MDKTIQKGRVCTLVLDPESSSAIEFGNQVFGKVLGEDVIDADRGALNEMYQTQNRLPVVVVEDEAGIKMNIPERDIKKIMCGEEELCD